MNIYVSGGRYDSFLSFDIILFGARPNIIYLKSELFKWWMSHSDMTIYGHVIMLVEGIDYFIQLHLLIFKCEWLIITWLSRLLSL